MESYFWCIVHRDDVALNHPMNRLESFIYRHPGLGFNRTERWQINSDIGRKQWIKNLMSNQFHYFCRLKGKLLISLL